MSEPTTEAGQRAVRALRALSDIYHADTLTASRAVYAIDAIRPAEIEAEVRSELDAALLHLVTRRHEHTMDCDGCRDITQHVNAALASELIRKANAR